MTIVLHDSFLNAAQADLQSDKVLVKEEGLFSQTLYNLEQFLEKGSKALFSYYAVTHEKLSGEEVYKLLKEFAIIT
jgi:HEPN domain-containing protein